MIWVWVCEQVSWALVCVQETLTQVCAVGGLVRVCVTWTRGVECVWIKVCFPSGGPGTHGSLSPQDLCSPAVACGLQTGGALYDCQDLEVMVEERRSTMCETKFMVIHNKASD